MITPITRGDEKDAVVDAWRKIFQTTDPFTWPFQSNILTGRILFPTDGYHLTELQYKSLLNAIRCTGTSSFLLAIVESDQNYLKKDQSFWKCELPEYREYCDIDIALENAIFSPSGHWGILISHEMHGILGAGKSFVSSFNASAGDGIQEVDAFESQWKVAESQDWLTKLLEHVTR